MNEIVAAASTRGRGWQHYEVVLGTHGGFASILIKVWKDLEKKWGRRKGKEWLVTYVQRRVVLWQKDL